MTDTSAVLRRLSDVDWDFTRSGTQDYSANSLHWFPGNFIPQIPSYFVQLLSRPGDTVLDPFCGSGTTGVEACLLGRTPILLDAVEAAVHVSRGKLSLLNANPMSLQDIATQLRLGRMGCGSAAPPSQAVGVTDWYHPRTIEDLAAVWNYVIQLSGPERAVLELLFADVLFRAAAPAPTRSAAGNRRKHHWGWVADNVRPKALTPHDVFGMMIEDLERAIGAVRAANRSTTSAWICERHDARDRLPAADLVVTSPPYLGMIDYTLANRLTYGWFGWDTRRDLGTEIGARRHRDRVNAELQYIADMERVRDRLHESVRPGGYVCIVLGASRKYPSAAEKVFTLFSETFEIFWGPKPRTASRRRVSNRSGDDFVESICVFRRE